MGASRKTREEVLERQVLAATVAFVATFGGVSYALVPYAIELPAAFSRADTGNFPFTPQHVSIGAPRGGSRGRAVTLSAHVCCTHSSACRTRSATPAASTRRLAWRAAARVQRLRAAATRVVRRFANPLTALMCLRWPHAAHLVACIAFCATLLQSLTTWSFSTHPLKSQVALLVSLVNGVSATLYLAKCLGHVTIVASGVPGEHMMPLRYVQWLFTTGCLIRTLACLSPEGPGAARALRRTLRWDAFMLACGCAERLLPSPANSVAFAVSAVGFWGTMAGQYSLFALGTQTLSTRGDKVALRALQRATTITWLLFPAARLLCWQGVLGTNGEEVIFSVLDVLAKFGYSTFLMVGTFTLAAKGAE